MDTRTEDLKYCLKILRELISKDLAEQDRDLVEQLISKYEQELYGESKVMH